MVKLKATGGGDFETLPIGTVVDVRLTDVEARQFTWDGEEVTKLKWVFTVMEEGAWKGKDIFGDTPTTFTAHPNCIAYNWVAAITGKKYAPDEQLDTDDLIGMPCRIMIGHREDKQGRTWMRAKEVLPARAGATTTAQPTAPEETPF